VHTNRSAQRDVPLLPEQRVGAALRTARQEAGLSLREMARRLNYGSHSTLSEYENGARMPSEIVVEEYERLLQLAAGTLTRMLEAANIERHGDAWARRRVHLPLRLVPAEEPAADQVRPGPSPTADASRWSVAASPWPRQPVADGADPDAAGCSADAITAHSRRIALTERRTVIGHIELRYCPRSRAAWGRFEGFGYLDHLAGQRNDVRIIVEVLRCSDSTRLATSEQYCFDYMWSDLVTVDSGRFQARATVIIDDEAVAAGETDAQKLCP